MLGTFPIHRWRGVEFVGRRQEHTRFRVSNASEMASAQKKLGDPLMQQHIPDQGHHRPVKSFCHSVLLRGVRNGTLMVNSMVY